MKYDRSPEGKESDFLLQLNLTDFFGAEVIEHENEFGMMEEGVLQEGAIANVVGIQSLQMGVFGGIIVGLGVAALCNRFYKIKLPQVLSFFGGSRFVPIISTAVR